ncbi:BMC domain-containing protein [Tropicimonas sp. TH_r6]|nr:BMC domain-containing protein [Tropicimonas sp. TH_r6]MDV7143970.1 BMC domain-containing protein [Tropicimonas sp. TH_r6]
MPQLSLGLIETVGLVAAVEAADAAVKAANVELVGYESAKGGGMMTVKLRGEVGAVKAAVAAAEMAASRVNKVIATKVIARPAEGLDGLVTGDETRGLPAKPAPEPTPEPAPVEAKPEAPKPAQTASAKPTAPEAAAKPAAETAAASPAPAKKSEDVKKAPARQARKPEPTSH